MPDRRRRRARRRRREQGFAAEKIKRAIAASLVEQFKNRPEVAIKLTEMGLVDAEVIENPDQELDLGAMLRKARDRISELSRSEPSVLAKLDVRPLEMLVVEDEPAPGGNLARSDLAVLFSDLEGFTRWTSDNGDLEAGALLHDHYESVDAIVKARGGSVIKTIGDGHMVAFPQVAAAVMAATELPAAEAGPLRIRIGAHHGRVVQARGDLLGHVVNVAARVADLAPGGVVLVTTEVRDLAGPLPGIDYLDERSEPVDGIAEPLRVCEVVAA